MALNSQPPVAANNGAAGEPAAPEVSLPPAASGAATFGGVPVAAIEAVMAERASHLAYGHTTELDAANRNPGDLARLAEGRLKGAIDHAMLGSHDQARKLLARAAAFILAEMDALELRRQEREG